MGWLKAHAQGVLIRVYVQPKAARSEIVGLHGAGSEARLKLRIAAPPVEGAANSALLEFLKKRLGISLSELQLLRGEKSRAKDVVALGITIDGARAKLKSEEP